LWKTFPTEDARNKSNIASKREGTTLNKMNILPLPLSRFFSKL